MCARLLQAKLYMWLVPCCGSCNHATTWLLLRRLAMLLCWTCALQVSMQDFEAALDEVQPAFGANAESLQKNVMQVRVTAVHQPQQAAERSCPWSAGHNHRLDLATA